VYNVEMTNTIDKIIRIITLIILSLLAIIELTNLIGFGTQEYYLQHPGFPVGSDYLNEIKSGKQKLIILTIITFGILISIIYSIAKRKQNMTRKLVILTFTFSMSLPILAFINGKILTGISFGLIFITIIILTINNGKTKLNKNTVHNNGNRCTSH
tara:strand:+ start:46 stop:513 length:468 start_codon:yes stop_codon:yes gene_type:complete